MLSNHIAALINTAKLTAKISNNPADSVVMQVMIVSPKGQFSSLGVERFVEKADFLTDHCTSYLIRLRLQPSVYFDHLVPYRDDLEMHVMSKSGTDSVLRVFTCVPLVDKDVRTESNNTVANNLEALDQTNMVPYEFQLIEKGYNKLKNQPVSNIYQMSNVTDVIKTIMDGESKRWSADGYDTYKGLYMVEPVDNINKFRQIEIPQGMMLKDVVPYLQLHNEYGVYTRGAFAFYKQNYWWVGPTFNTELVDTHHRPIDLIRVPQSKIPDLDSTFYRTDASMTIIATGDAEHEDRADIRKQNTGVGKRVIMGDAIAGDTGYHYNNGRAITTRADTLQEYKLSERRDGNEYIPIDRSPTGNLCKAFSENAFNEGEIVKVEWRNGDVGYIEPCHPTRYQYVYDDDTTVIRKGVIIGYRSDYVPITSYPTPMLKRTTILYVFLKRQAKYKAETTE